MPFASANFWFICNALTQGPILRLHKVRRKKMKLAFLSLKKYVYEPGLHSQEVTITKKQID